ARAATQRRRVCAARRESVPGSPRQAEVVSTLPVGRHAGPPRWRQTTLDASRVRAVRSDVRWSGFARRARRAQTLGARGARKLRAGGERLESRANAAKAAWEAIAGSL